MLPNEIACRPGRTSADHQNLSACASVKSTSLALWDRSPVLQVCSTFCNLLKINLILCSLWPSCLVSVLSVSLQTDLIRWQRFRAQRTKLWAFWSAPARLYTLNHQYQLASTAFKLLFSNLSLYFLVQLVLSEKSPPKNDKCKNVLCLTSDICIKYMMMGTRKIHSK